MALTLQRRPINGRRALDGRLDDQLPVGNVGPSAKEADRPPHIMWNMADALEADWNHKLRALAEAKGKYEQQREADRKMLDAGERAQVRALATDFPKLWQDPRTSDRERKRMVRLMLEDVTLIKDQQITLHIRFKGGAATTMHLPIPPNGPSDARLIPPSSRRSIVC